MEFGWWWVVGSSFLEASELFDFAVNGVAPQMRVVLLFFYPFGLEFLVASTHVARNRFIFCFGFCALQDNDLTWHNSY